MCFCQRPRCLRLLPCVYMTHMPVRVSWEEVRDPQSCRHGLLGQAGRELSSSQGSMPGTALGCKWGAEETLLEDWASPLVPSVPRGTQSAPQTIPWVPVLTRNWHSQRSCPPLLHNLGMDGKGIWTPWTLASCLGSSRAGVELTPAPGSPAPRPRTPPHLTSRKSLSPTRFRTR